MAGPGCHALATMLTRNTTLRHLCIFWAGADHDSVTALAAALASNSSLTSLTVGDPRSLSAAQATRAAASILSSATTHLRRLSFSYVTIPSPALAAHFCSALESASGIVELCLPYLAIKYSLRSDEVVGRGGDDEPSLDAPPSDGGEADQGLRDAATEADAAALLGRVLQHRGPSLQSLELPFMHARSAAAAHAAVLAPALELVSVLTRLDLLQVPPPGAPTRRMCMTYHSIDSATTLPASGIGLIRTRCSVTLQPRPRVLSRGGVGCIPVSLANMHCRRCLHHVSLKKKRRARQAWEFGVELDTHKPAQLAPRWHKLCTQGIAFLYTTAVVAHTFGYIYNRLSMSQIVTMAVVVGNRMRLSGETCCVQVSLSMSDWREVVAKLSACASLTALRLSHPLPAQPSADGPDVPPVDVEAALTPLRLRGVTVDVGALMHTSEGGFRPRPWGVTAAEVAARGAELLPQAQLEYEAERQDKAALQESVESSTFSQGEARRAVDALRVRTAALQRELQAAHATTAEAERMAQEVMTPCMHVTPCSRAPRGSSRRVVRFLRLNRAPVISAQSSCCVHSFCTLCMTLRRLRGTPGAHVLGVLAS